MSGSTAACAPSPTQAHPALPPLVSPRQYVHPAPPSPTQRCPALCSQGLRELDIRLFLDALVDVLSDKVTGWGRGRIGYMHGSALCGAPPCCVLQELRAECGVK